jgi:hypothetical protein
MMVTMERESQHAPDCLQVASLGILAFSPLKVEDKQERIEDQQ